MTRWGWQLECSNGWEEKPTRSFFVRFCFAARLLCKEFRSSWNQSSTRMTVFIIDFCAFPVVIHQNVKAREQVCGRYSLYRCCFIWKKGEDKISHLKKCITCFIYWLLDLLIWSLNYLYCKSHLASKHLSLTQLWYSTYVTFILFQRLNFSCFSIYLFRHCLSVVSQGTKHRAEGHSFRISVRHLSLTSYPPYPILIYP